MRWQANKGLTVGDRRVITQFIFFPKELNGEVRWLETAKINQVVTEGYTIGWYRYWRDDYFVPSIEERDK